MTTAAVEGGLVDLDPDDVEPGSGEHLSDARTHRAQSYDADLVKFLHHGPHLRRPLDPGRARGPELYY
ncbi:hypothetical protein GCM10027590_67170 [Nocardiopsis nanhaiensis]